MSKINPLSTLSIEELKQLVTSIDKKFYVKKINDQVVEDYQTKYLNIYNQFLNYIVENKVIIKKGNEELNLSYGHVAQLLIWAELNERLNIKGGNNEE